MAFLVPRLTHILSSCMYLGRIYVLLVVLLKKCRDIYSILSSIICASILRKMLAYLSTKCNINCWFKCTNYFIIVIRYCATKFSIPETWDITRKRMFTNDTFQPWLLAFRGCILTVQLRGKITVNLRPWQHKAIIISELKLKYLSSVRSIHWIYFCY